ncbi:PqqD family protein [bacterium]|nr:PqqD family protein [bacterium]
MKKTSDRFIIKDSGLILDLVSGHSFTANPTALVIFREILEGSPKEKIVKKMCNEFSIDSETFQQDLDEFLLELKVMGVYED